MPVKNFAPTSKDLARFKNHFCKLHDMIVERNRFHGHQTSITRTLDRAEKSFRKARTRTLIQVGSLCKLAGLFDLFHIDEGEDLQINLISKDKAAALLGHLVQNCEELNSIDPKTFQKLKSIGIRKMGDAK